MYYEEKSTNYELTPAQLLAAASSFLYVVCMLLYVFWPKFLPMKLRAPTRTRGGNHEALLLPSNNIDNTFGACAPKIFNDLPQEVRTCGEYKVFLKKTKSFLFDKALARSFS